MDLDEAIDILQNKLEEATPKQAEFGEQILEWAAWQVHLSMYTSIVSELNLTLTEVNTYVSFPIPLENCLTPTYIQSWRCDRFGSSAWIKYSHGDGTWQYEHRCGFVYKSFTNTKEFVLVEDYPKCLNPFRFFSMDDVLERRYVMEWNF